MEEVYWRHRIWPKDHPETKPLLAEVISQRLIEKKVEEYLRKSSLLAGHGRTITPSELQAEMVRMAGYTKQAAVLRELFTALRNDPFVIAECLARPLLAERLVSELTVNNGLDAFKPSTKVLAGTNASASQSYALPEISGQDDCVDNSWTATTIANAPEARDGHTSVWTGSEVIVWGGENVSGNFLNTGSRYIPATDSWNATSITNAPTIRWYHTAVWTGSEMIIWGGGGNGSVSTGGKYNPVTDNWDPTSSTNTPVARIFHTAVWTGAEMIVWGGTGCGGNCRLNSGGRYNPVTDTWTATSLTNVPAARINHTTIWTGSEMIVWGGNDPGVMNRMRTGGRYNPTTDAWIPTGLMNVPPGCVFHTAVWTGSEMIIWGGKDDSPNGTNTGARYNPIADSWVATTLSNAPLSRAGHTAVWTGIEMIIWGGASATSNQNTGGRYDPPTDSWTPMTTANAPLARQSHTAVWTGSEMIVWGGLNFDVGMFLNTGGRYCAQLSTPTPTPTTTATPSPTPTSSPTPTPSASVTATPSPTPTPISTPSATPWSTPTAAPAQALNISTRLRVQTGNNVLIGGFIIAGSMPKNVAVRGIGPSLGAFGVPDALADPILELRGATGTVILASDDWQSDPGQEAQLIDLGLALQDPKESGLVATVQPGSYTAILSGVNQTTGVGLVEVYDTNQAANSQLDNISTRGLVLTEANVMIGGFILGGSRNTHVVVRGIGPSLAQFGITDVLADPTLELHDGNGILLVSNDNWQDDVTSASHLTALGLAPQNAAESGIYRSLPPGAFTAILAGTNSGTGIGLIEIYNVH